jgi:hypothetical protein
MKVWIQWVTSNHLHLIEVEMSLVNFFGAFSKVRILTGISHTIDSKSRSVMNPVLTKRRFRLSFGLPHFLAANL